MKPIPTKSLAFLALSLSALRGAASPGDLSFPPRTSGGHDFNHSPIGQTFTAMASDVTAGIYLMDAASFETWLATVYPGQITPGSYPYQISPSITVRVELRDGEGTGGAVLYSEDRVLAAPFGGFVELDAGAAGVRLVEGSKYTLLLTDIAGQSYPQGVTGWVVPAFGPYDGGSAILQGVLGTNESDAFTGDTCFQVLNNVISGTDAVITAYAARSPGFIVINGGLELNDHLWTTNLNASNTVFLDGLVNWYQAGLLVDYTGIRTAQGVVLNSLTVHKAVPPLTFPAPTLGNAVVGIPYNQAVAVSVTGGVGPYSVTLSGLPAGLSFDGNQLGGIPTLAGAYAPVIQVTDTRGTVAETTVSLTVDAPAAPPVSAYTIREESKGKITVVGDGFLMVGARKLIWDASTVIKVNTSKGNLGTITSAIKPGQAVQWKGLLNKSTATVLASKLEVN